MELARLLMADCKTTGDVQAKLKRLFAGTIEQMLEAEMDEHLGYEKNSVEGNSKATNLLRCSSLYILQLRWGAPQRCLIWLQL